MMIGLLENEVGWLVGWLFCTTAPSKRQEG